MESLPGAHCFVVVRDLVKVDTRTIEAAGPNAELPRQSPPFCASKSLEMKHVLRRFPNEISRHKIMPTDERSDLHL